MNQSCRLDYRGLCTFHDFRVAFPWCQFGERLAVPEPERQELKRFDDWLEQVRGELKGIHKLIVQQGQSTSQPVKRRTDTVPKSPDVTPRLQPKWGVEIPGDSNEQAKGGNK